MSTMRALIGSAEEFRHPADISNIAESAIWIPRFPFAMVPMQEMSTEYITINPNIINILSTPELTAQRSCSPMAVEVHLHLPAMGNAFLLGRALKNKTPSAAM